MVGVRRFHGLTMVEWSTCGEDKDGGVFDFDFD